MACYLIVANQTIGGEQLTAKLDELVSAGSSAFRFLVPVTDSEGTQQWDYPPIDRHIPDAHRIARVLAEGRLEHELARMGRSGSRPAERSSTPCRSTEPRSCSTRSTSTVSWSRPCRVDCPGG